MISRRRILILSRRGGGPAARLADHLAGLGELSIIVDAPGHGGVWIPDAVAMPFAGTMSPGFPPINAWSRAFVWLAAHPAACAWTWIIEEDVAGPPAAFAALMAGSEALVPSLAAIDQWPVATQPGWSGWALGRGIADPLMASFNPLCLLHPSLVAAVCRWCLERGRAAFHEVMLASLAQQLPQPVLAWRQHPALGRHFGAFRWRPAIGSAELGGIVHPVKCAQLHATAFESPAMA